jgi:phosphoenolpyruvate carboxykinase (ATP)
MEIDPVFGFAAPTSVPGVDPAILRPRLTWKSAADYDAQARKLARMFADNFKAFAPFVPPEVRAAGPRL